MADIKKYEEYYSNESFMDKVSRCAAMAGREVLLKAFQLYYVLGKPDVPVWAKGTIMGAIGYFILPADIVPDILPAVSMYVDDEVTANAEKKVNQLLG